jgi:hypothetical protein
MVPGAVPPSITLNIMLYDRAIELNTAEKRDQLTKQVCTTYHEVLCSSGFGISLLLAQQRSPMRRTLFQSVSKSVLAQECPEFHLQQHQALAILIKYGVLLD